MKFSELLQRCAPIDFEFNGTKEARYNLVSVALDSSVTGLYSDWLHQDQEAKADLRTTLLTLRSYGNVLLAYNVDAEAKALISLGLNPIKFKWIDLQAEWKHLTNHNDRLRYGRHFIDGKIKRTFRREYGDQDDKRPHDRPPMNLLGCTFKMLNVSEEEIKEAYSIKNDLRDFIIKGKNLESRKDEILSYGESDIHELKDILIAMMREYKHLLRGEYDSEELIKEMLWRGESVARAAVISATGYPVNREKVINFKNNIPTLIKDCQEDINSQFPERPPFKWNKKENRYSVDTKAVKEYINESNYSAIWDKTAKGDMSLSLDAFERHYHYRHDFPRDNFGAQFLRWLKLNQSLNGFRPKSVTAKNRDTFFSYYGSDDRAHPYLNSYGAQSSRYQPKATGYLHLKASWMRSLVEPKPGRSIAAIDYGSQEFLLAALMSGDENMIKAYESGDVYLYFAKLAGAVPWDGKKSDYKEERNVFKSTTLGISYQMGAAALARKLSEDTGREFTTQDAYELINKFKNAYPDYQRWIESNEITYVEQGYLKLPDGWYMWGDNDNVRSVGNMPVQGFGATILRKAVQLCQDAGLSPIIVLHDALYVEIASTKLRLLSRFTEYMREAFAFYFAGEKKNLARDLVRLDGNLWGPDVKPGEIDVLGTKFKCERLYVDERGFSQYKQFSKYFIGQSSQN